jgi:cystine transport system permease protein
MFIELFKEHFVELLIAGIKYTVPLAIIAFALSLILAIVSAFIGMSESKNFLMHWVLQPLNKFYIWLFRSTPLLLQLFIIFYGIPKAFPAIALSTWSAAIIGFSLNTGAYSSEIIRGAILGVPAGQTESARSLGMSPLKTYRYVILPQAFRIAIPPLSNSFIALVKDTSLASAITMVEIMQTAQQIAAQNYQPLDTYLIAAIIYAIFSTVLSQLQKVLENHFKKFDSI